MTIPSELLNQVVCMDCFALMEQIPDGVVDAVITDLPYGTTACSWDTIIPFEPMWAAVKRVLKPRGVFVTTASQPFTSALVMSNPKWFRCEWIWEKDNGTNFLNLAYQPFKTHENVLVFASQAPDYQAQMEGGTPYRALAGKVYRPYLDAFEKGTLTVNEGTRHPRSIIRVNAQRGLHGTQKPVALYEYLIRTYTQTDDVVLDFCCGSGTTALAARNTGRRYIAGDSSAEYVDIANRRLAMPYTLPMMLGE